MSHLSKVLFVWQDSWGETLVEFSDMSDGDRRVFLRPLSLSINAWWNRELVELRLNGDVNLIQWGPKSRVLKFHTYFPTFHLPWWLYSFPFFRRHNFFKGPETSTLILTVRRYFDDWFIATMLLLMSLAKCCIWVWRSDINLFHLAFFFFFFFFVQSKEKCGKLLWYDIARRELFSLLQICQTKLTFKGSSSLFKENSCCWGNNCYFPRRR